MRFFQRHRQEAEQPQFDRRLFEPVIRASICTGERVACMRNRESGRLHELMLIRTEEDLDRFCRETGTEKENIKTVY